MNHWLVKSEPETYSFERFRREKSTAWTGVRNYAARIFLREMARGDEVFFYHSGEARAIVGLATVAKTAYLDPTIEPDEKGDWVCVDLKAGPALARAVTLAEIKANAKLGKMELVRQSRLSVSPVGEKEAALLKKLGGL